MPSIAQTLQLNWNSCQRRVAQRVREACAAIERHDSRYCLSFATGSQPGTWVLTCMRTQAKWRGRSAAIPEVLIRAWRECNRSHLQSWKQRSVLMEGLDSGELG